MRVAFKSQKQKNIVLGTLRKPFAIKHVFFLSQAAHSIYTASLQRQIAQLLITSLSIFSFENEIRLDPLRERCKGLMLHGRGYPLKTALLWFWLMNYSIPVQMTRRWHVLPQHVHVRRATRFVDFAGLTNFMSTWPDSNCWPPKKHLETQC